MLAVSKFILCQMHTAAVDCKVSLTSAVLWISRTVTSMTAI